jgi:hypothetical protein
MEELYNTKTSKEFLLAKNCPLSPLFQITTLSYKQKPLIRIEPSNKFQYQVMVFLPQIFNFSWRNLPLSLFKTMQQETTLLNWKWSAVIIRFNFFMSQYIVNTEQEAVSCPLTHLHKQHKTKNCILAMDVSKCTNLATDSNLTWHINFLSHKKAHSTCSLMCHPLI